MGLLGFGALYSCALFVLVGTWGVLERVFGTELVSLRGEVPAIAIFVVGSAAAPFLSASLRRLKVPGISLRARAISSAGFVASVSIVLFALDRSSINDIAWAFGVSGLISFFAWSTAYRNVLQLLEPRTQNAIVT